MSGDHPQLDGVTYSVSVGGTTVKAANAITDDALLTANCNGGANTIVYEVPPKVKRTASDEPRFSAAIIDAWISICTLIHWKSPHCSRAGWEWPGPDREMLDVLCGAAPVLLSISAKRKESGSSFIVSFMGMLLRAQKMHRPGGEAKTALRVLREQVDSLIDLGFGRYHQDLIQDA